SELLDLMREAFYVGLGHVVWVLVQYAPLILVANLVGGAETAWFGAPHRIVVSLLTLSFVYHFNLYPAIARRAGAPPEHLRDPLHASFRVAAWGGILIALLLTLLARPLLLLAYGAPFAAAVPVFAVLVWTLPVTLL